MSSVSNEYYDTFMELWRDKFISKFGTEPAYNISEEEKAFPVALLDLMLLAVIQGAEHLHPDIISKQASLFFVRRNSHEGLDGYSRYIPYFVQSVQDTLHNDHHQSIIRNLRLPENDYIGEYENYVLYSLDLSAKTLLSLEEFRSLPFQLGSVGDGCVYRFLADALTDYCEHVSRIVDDQERSTSRSVGSAGDNTGRKPIMTFGKFIKLAIIGLIIGFILYLLGK